MTTDSGTWTIERPSVDSLKQRLVETLDRHFEHFDSDIWGEHWETAGNALPVVMVHPNMEVEEGMLYVPGHPEVTALIDAVHLDDEQLRIIQSLGGTPIEEYQHEST